MSPSGIRSNLPRESIHEPEGPDRSSRRSLPEGKVTVKGRNIKETTSNRPQRPRRLANQGSLARIVTKNLKALAEAERSLKYAVNRLLGELAHKPNQLNDYRLTPVGLSKCCSRY